MLLSLIGLNHKTAPLNIRERAAIGANDLVPALIALKKRCPECLILSTCNRVEVYGLVGHPEKGRQKLIDFLAHYCDVPIADLQDHVYSHHQTNAIRHLFAVAAGLDSMIIGEPQILGQLRTALEVASSAGTIGTVFSRLFRQALHVGKRVRSESDIGRGATSISYAAVQIARRHLATVPDPVVVIIGAGEMGELAARILIDFGVGSVLIANRTLTNAQELAERLGCKATGLDGIEQWVSSADAVIAAAGTTDYIVTAEHLLPLLPARSRPLLLVDIGVPRNIDPALRLAEKVTLYDIDDLQRICSETLQRREVELEAAQRIIDEEVDDFLEWWNALEVVPTIKALVAHVERIREIELSKHLGKLSGLTEKEKAIVEALTKSITGKILHLPITRMKQGKRSEEGYDYCKAVRELFDLAPVSETALTNDLHISTEIADDVRAPAKLPS